MTTKMKEDAVRVLTSEEEDVKTSLSLGAQASLQTIYEAPASPELLRRTLSNTLTWQARNENTIVKVILSPNLAPQFVTALLALGARLLFDTMADSKAAQGLLADYLRQDLSHHQPLSAIHIPLDVPGRRWGESQVARTPADEPIVAAIAVVDLADDVVRRAHLALTGVWSEHTRLARSAGLLPGGALSDDRIQQVATAVAREVEPPDDFRGSADYRRAMATVLTRRALEECRKARRYKR